MPISAYLRWLRSHVGRDLVLMPGVTGIVTDQENWDVAELVTVAS
jgi:hypothetical protein